MAANRPPQLIGYGLDSFDLQGSHLQQNGHAGMPQVFRSIVNGLQQAALAPVDIDEVWQGKEAYYFRAGAASNDDSVDNQDVNVISGVAISRDRETRTCRVEGMFNNAKDRAVDAGTHYLWTRKIIPQFSRTISCQGDTCVSGTPSSEVRFGRAIDAPTRRLLDTFGLNDGAGWTIPLPRFAVQGTIGSIDGWMADMSEEDMDNTTLVIQKDGTKIIETRFIEDGHRLGRLLSGLGKETLLDSKDREVPITMPDFGSNPAMAESFAQPVIRRQLGFVTLKKSLLAAV